MKGTMIKFTLKVLITWVALAPFGLFAQNLLLNGNFETGNLSDWTTFLTANGDLGAGSGLPNVVSFDVAGTGTATDAAQFMAGEATFDGISQGGGIYQSFSCSAGQYVVSADVAAYNPYHLANNFAGTFSILIDGNSMSSTRLNLINTGQTLRGTLDTTLSLGEGSHVFTLEITRPALSGGSTYGLTPLEYVDDLSVVQVPEPRGLFPLGFAVLLLAGLKRYFIKQRSGD
jgi:hypothetical protein